MYTLACICFGACSSQALNLYIQQREANAALQLCFAVFWLLVALLFR